MTDGRIYSNLLHKSRPFGSLGSFIKSVILWIRVNCFFLFNWFALRPPASILPLTFIGGSGGGAGGLSVMFGVPPNNPYFLSRILLICLDDIWAHFGVNSSLVSFHRCLIYTIGSCCAINIMREPRFTKFRRCRAYPAVLPKCEYGAEKRRTMQPPKYEGLLYVDTRKPWLKGKVFNSRPMYKKKTKTNKIRI